MLDLLLPQRCVVCERPGPQACTRCLVGFRCLSPPLCERCGAPTAWPVGRCRECAGRRIAFAQARSAVAYDEAVRRFVSAWKERGLRRLARAAGERAADALERPSAALLTFVPADVDRGLRRGYHPAESLARAHGTRWELPVERLLARPRPLPRQRGLSLAERRRNVAGAFAARGAVPARVALVDDVYTSGATVNAAASALRKAGARRVEVVTFARAVRE